MATYNTSDFRKGLKVQIDGEPYLMTDMQFVKPGQRKRVLQVQTEKPDSRHHFGSNLKGWRFAGISRRGNDRCGVFVPARRGLRLHAPGQTFEQYEVSSDVAGDIWKYLKDGMKCTMTLYNGNAIIVEPPTMVELEVTDCAPGAKGDTATNVTKPAKVETGAEFVVPGFIKLGNIIKVDTRTGEYSERVSN